MTKTRDQVRREWIEALESGEYGQARGRLRLNESEFCCLGVLCDLSRRDGGADWNMGFYDDTDSFLPEPIRRLIGLHRNTMMALARDNDHGAGFAEIAARLRRLWEIK